MPTEYSQGAAPTTVDDYMVNFQTRVRVGKSRHYGSLSVTGTAYTNYSASIGLQAGGTESFDLGRLASVGSTISAEFEDLEVANVTSGLKIVSEESAVVNMDVYEWKPDLFALLVSTGDAQAINTDEYLIRFGGACSGVYRPLELYCENVGCFQPSAEDVTAGLTGLVVTFYDGLFVSGLQMEDLQATGQPVTVSAEYAANPWLDRAAGNQLGNIYMF